MKWLGLWGTRHYYINSSSLLILSTLSCLKGGMALPAFAARELGPRLQREQGAPARTTCPRRHSRLEAELAASRPGSVAASVREGLPRGVSHGFNSSPLRDEPPKASSSLAGALRAPLFALLPRGRRRRMHDLRRRWDLGSLCRALLTRGLAALGHWLKHVLSAVFSKIFGPLARYVWGAKAGLGLWLLGRAGIVWGGKAAGSGGKAQSSREPPLAGLGDSAGWSGGLGSRRAHTTDRAAALFPAAPRERQGGAACLLANSDCLRGFLTLSQVSPESLGLWVQSKRPPCEQRDERQGSPGLASSVRRGGDWG